MSDDLFCKKCKLKLTMLFTSAECEVCDRFADDPPTVDMSTSWIIVTPFIINNHGDAFKLDSPRQTATEAEVLRALRFSQTVAPNCKLIRVKVCEPADTMLPADVWIPILVKIDA